MTVQIFEPTGAREALLAPLLRGVLKALLKPAFSPRWSIAAQRRWLAGMARLNLPPRGVVITAGAAGLAGAAAAVAAAGAAGAAGAAAAAAALPGEWTRPRTGCARQGTVLYLHGGAYCVGRPATHRPITGALARGTGMAVLSLDYRLAPEQPFPAALDDALAAFDALRALGPVVLAGDSAGGGLALATALALRDRHGPVAAAGAGDIPPAEPAALLLLAPWSDLTLAQLPEPTPGEAMLSRPWVAACAAHYLAGADARQAGVSPLLADLRGLPTTLIQVGTDDLLHAEALRLHAALQAAGVPVRCEVTAGRWHVFQLQAGVLPCADEALARAAGFIGEAVDQAAAATASTTARATGRATTATATATATAAATAAAAAASPVEDHQVVILGAGMSGLCMAVQLKQAGMHDFVMLEKSAGLGGTWWDNRYPGAQVDVPAPLYSFSFAANPHWKRRFADAPEIQAYMQRVAVQHGVHPHLRLGTRLTEARFDEASGHWHLTTAHGQRLRARFFVCSTGPLSQARFPDIPGLADFQGRLLHSARWDAAADLAGQRVAVIGTGSTASQLIPPIAAQAAQLHVFQRTANWVLPRLDRHYNTLDGLLTRLPPYAAAVRGLWYRALELGRKGFDEGTLARRRMLKMAADQLRNQVADPALRAKLTPTYPLGCKRLIYSNEFLPTFSRPNAELVTEAITRITPHGIVTADGRERPIDALVCATGFDTVQLLSTLQVTGLGGRTLREAWQDGPEAHLGITVAGFPNLFLMLGPNTATGHTSTLLYIEPAVRYAIACIQQVQAAGQRWLDVRPEVFRASNERLQARLQGSVWTTCRSWYRTEGGKVVALWPGFTDEYLQALRRPDFTEFVFG
jgi:cation diffusion facilitator CzcD-associated flavoprotein CzcO/acetyl esterase/lipase